MDESAPKKHQSNTTEYWCFISYRHADNYEQDRNWASWLHQEIERYDVPAELVGTVNERGDTIPERIYPVFRDEDSLPADANLTNSILGALERSRFMVALCSPRSVLSQYCTQEIHYFKKIGKADRLIAVILAGVPGKVGDECFCLPLLYSVREDGTLDTSINEEPIAADFRIIEGGKTREGYTSAEAYRLELNQRGDLTKKEVKRRTEAFESRLQLMKLKIIAGVLGVPLEHLRDRDKAYQLEVSRRKNRRQTLISSVFAFISIVALIATYVAVKQREKSEMRLILSRFEEAKAWRERAIQKVSLADRAFSNKEVRHGNKLLFEAALMSAKALEYKGLGLQGDPSYIELDASNKFGSECQSIFAHSTKQLFAWQVPPHFYHKGGLIDIKWSPDGTKFVSTSHGIQIWDSKSGMLLADLQPPIKKAWEASAGNIVCVSWNPDGSELVSGSDTGYVHFWNPEKAVIESELKLDSSIFCIDWERGGAVACGSRDGKLTIINSEQREIIGSVEAHQSLVWRLKWKKNEKILASVGHDHIHVWDFEKMLLLFSLSCAPHHPLPDHGKPEICWSPDGKQLVSVGGDMVQVWDAQSGDLIANGKSEFDLQYVSWADSKQDLATTSITGGVKLWQIDGEVLKQRDDVLKHRKFDRIAWAPSGDLLLGVDSSGEFILFDKNGKERTTKGHRQAITCSSWSPEGRFLATGSEGGRVKIWKATNGELLTTLIADDEVVDVAWNPAKIKNEIAVAHSRSISIWDPASSKKIAVMKGHADKVTSIDWSPNGQILASASLDMSIKLWNSNQSTLLGTMQGDQQDYNGDKGVTCLKWSPDGSKVAAGGINGSIDIWGGSERKKIKSLSPHEYEVQSVAWSPDGRIIASGSSGGAKGNTIKVWDVERGVALRTLIGHPGGDRINYIGDDGVRDMSWSTTGTYLSSCGVDGKIKIWETKHYENVMSINGHHSTITSISWFRDDLLASGTDDGTVTLTPFSNVPSDFHRFENNNWVKLDGASVYWVEESKNPANHGWIASHPEWVPTGVLRNQE